MPEITAVLNRMVAKFEARMPLEPGDRDAFLNLPFKPLIVDAHSYIVREGQTLSRSALLVAGLSYRQKLTVDGSRQILCLNIPGDFVDLEASLLNRADHNVQALTRCEFAVVPRADMKKLLLEHPVIAHLLWVDTLIDASIYREWIVNIGRRDARARTCHLLCELGRRLQAAGLATTRGYELPMTQEQLADALGLTSVHVNRMFRSLENEGLLRREKRFIVIDDWEKLRDVAGFNENYLHLEQATRQD